MTDWLHKQAELPPTFLTNDKRLGGDITQPVCNGEKQAVGSITELYDTLSACKQRITEACVIDQDTVG